MAGKAKRPGPPKGTTYRKRGEIEPALLAAAVSLCREVPPEEITARAVAERAGVAPAYISRYGGGLQTLLIGAARQIIIAEIVNWSPGEAIQNPDVAAAVRLMAFLLANGTDPVELFGSGNPVMTTVAERLADRYDLGPESALRGARIAVIFFLGVQLFGELTGLDDADAAYFVDEFDQLLSRTEA